MFSCRGELPAACASRGGTTPSEHEYRQLIGSSGSCDRALRTRGWSRCASGPKRCATTRYRARTLRRTAAANTRRDRTSERHQRAHATRRAMRRVACEQPPQAPVDQADRSAMLVGHEFELALQCRCMPGLKADIAAEARGLYRVAAIRQIGLERGHRRLRCHEAGKQEDGTRIALRSAGQQRPPPRQRGCLKQPAREFKCGRPGASRSLQVGASMHCCRGRAIAVRPVVAVGFLTNAFEQGDSMGAEVGVSIDAPGYRPVQSLSHRPSLPRCATATCCLRPLVERSDDGLGGSARW